MNLCIFASDLSVVTGHNKWHSKDEIVLKIWQRNYPEDFQRIKTLWEKKKNKSSDTFFLTSEEYIQKTADQNNIKIEGILEKCKNSETVTELNKNKKKVISEINKSKISQAEKKILKDCVESSTNTQFGTRKEKKVVKKLKEDKLNVLTPGAFYTRPVITTPNNQWIIGGRIDGIVENETLIEIKNRIYKLFYKLRDYEKIQIYAYLYVLGITKAKLVESIVKKGDNEKEDSKDTNIIEVDFSIPYWQKTIVPSIREFVKHFEKFIKSDTLKLDLITELESSLS